MKQRISSADRARNFIRNVLIVGLTLLGLSSTAANAATVVNSVTDLQNIKNGLGGNYVLGQNIDASGFAFVPIGNSSKPFKGTLDGNGHTISNLAINSSAPNIGLFGVIISPGTITNLRLTNIHINGTSQATTCGDFASMQSVGSVAGSLRFGTINVPHATLMHIYVQGTVNGTSGVCDLAVGGIAGLIWGPNRINGSLTNIAVSGQISGPANGYFGGISGFGNPQIEYSGSVGSVAVTQTKTGTGHYEIGGIAGDSEGAITYSYATGPVTGFSANGTSNGSAGGLAGSLGEIGGPASVDYSFAENSVTATGTVGGLAGIAWGGTELGFSYATGRVTATRNGDAGGLIGQIIGVQIDQALTTGHATSAGGSIGGLIARSVGSGNIVTNSYWDTLTSGTSTSVGGTGLTTAQLTSATLPAGFDPNYWLAMRTSAVSKRYYPHLWEVPFPIIAFPLANQTPYRDAPPGSPDNSASIISVFDHTMQSFADPGIAHLYGCDGVVRAFTGAQGNWQNGTDPADKNPKTACSGLALGYEQSSKTAFDLASVHYTGTNSTGPLFLNYEGHAGIDFAASYLPVYAAVSGTIFYPWRAVGMTDMDAYCRFHALTEIPDDGPTYRIYYLHLKTHPAILDATTNPKCPSTNANYSAGQTVGFTPDPSCQYTLGSQSITPTTLPLPSGTHVTAGCQIAVSGSAGVPGPHLHFEIQQMLPISTISEGERLANLNCYDESNKTGYSKLPDTVCLPVDPYGWTGTATDCSSFPATGPGDAYKCFVRTSDYPNGLPSPQFWVQ